MNLVLINFISYNYDTAGSSYTMEKKTNMFCVIILFFIISFLIVYFIRCKDNFLF